MTLHLSSLDHIQHIDGPGSAEAEAVVLAAEVQTAPRPVAVAVELGAPGGNHLDEPHVVKSKQFALKPMSVDEATLQLELIGHSFFVFTNAETNDTNVVYRRRDGDFGLIEPVRS